MHFSVTNAWEDRIDILINGLCIIRPHRPYYVRRCSLLLPTQ